MNQLDDDEQLELTEKFQDTLVKWVKIETSAVPGYEALCDDLKELARSFIQHGKFNESIPILDIFYTIYSGRLKKDDAIQAIATKKIRGIATEDVLKALIYEFKTRARKREQEAGNNLARLGEAPVPILLNMLKEETGSTERVRIMDVIIKIGLPAVKSIQEEFGKNDPWYYKRNLIYLMGRIGGEHDAGMLVAFLKHDSNQVRYEALNSINRIGGGQRARLLLSVLEEVDDAIKIGIVDFLSSQKYEESVDALLHVLNARPLRASETRVSLERKICRALGNIGSPNAIPALEKISKPGFFKVKTYPKCIRTAAGNALQAIRAKSHA
jgi:hypothetical protein